ncbi:hypothetical protein [Candidatus Viridilinea mediisalina]|uniref:Uncharacterized protein n=1 Tax=Candidatus Viridilinea mediisalina TaxID=2024553 RepID=A0A2A6RH50_9CHLR|nr:hypothetical protein [Candidatus Viridilinea mediisalina]PDW02263.1 hypothetical protein CJ255_14970 [Candidatus Viridilinea mediisalina]
MNRLFTLRRWRPLAFVSLIIVGVAIVLALSRPRHPVYPAQHPAELYAPTATGPLYAPFQLEIDPMQHLLLINFEHDPDEVYLGFEPQVFADERHGVGMLVIGWRVDGTVDVFHQPGLRLDPATYAIAGGGLNELVERPLIGASFMVDEAGVQADISFDDLLGRPVVLRINERNPTPRKPFGLLAPMGAAATEPSALPLVYLREFYFVRQADTEVSILIDGVAHQPDTMPMPMDGMRMYFMRYSNDPLIVTLNPEQHGPLAPLVQTSANEAEANGTSYDLVEQHGHPAIAQMRRSLNDHEVRVSFTPPLPHLAAMADGASAHGGFQINADPMLGTLRGEYWIERRGNQVVLRATPSGGWEPNEAKWSANLIYRLAPIFSEWPRSYQWNATLDLAATPDAILQAAWQRVEP